jgi:hypothetical protein
MGLAKSLYCAYGDLKVCLLDGDEVRIKVDMDFTNFAQGPQYPYVPTNEMWVDKHSIDEIPFYITHMLTEREWLAHGENDKTADKLATIAEVALRIRSDNQGKEPSWGELGASVLREYRGKFMGYDSYLVYGRKVRLL